MLEGKAERAVELLMREGWAGLEMEYEIYCQSKTLRLFDFCVAHVHMLTRWTSVSAGQKGEGADMMAYHTRGIKRCARVREIDPVSK